MFPEMSEPRYRHGDPLLSILPPHRRTWFDLAVDAGVPAEHADAFLWSATAFPFAKARYIYEQIRHVLRHKVCYDDPGARCFSHRHMRHA